jgi:translocation and assembly module TamB
MRRWLLYGTTTIICLPVIASIVGKVYLSSHMTPHVVLQLQSALGVPVQIENADVGLSGGSELHGVQVFEPPAPAGLPRHTAASPRSEKPWFRVERIEADVSALGLLSGSTRPSKVALHGVSVTLRFDKDGNLLTRLPLSRPSTGVFPELVIDGGRVTIDQEGHEPLVVEGIAGTLMPDAGALKITGALTDAYWGRWNIGGKTDLALGAITLSLDNPKIDVTAEKLHKLPFVTPAVWQQVMAEGTTSVRLTLQIAENGSGNHCRVQLAPTETRVQVSCIELHADHASGNVVVEDQLVTLTGVTGRTADGTIGVNGTLDFRTAPSVLNLNVAVQNVTVQHLPRSWELPDVLDGSLTGAARLRLRLTEPVIQTEGSSGEGTVSGVSVLGLGEGSARLYLHPGPGRFSFRREPPPKKTVTPETLPASDLHKSPATKAASTSGPGIGGALDQVPQGLGMLASGLTNSAAAAIRGVRQLGDPPQPGTEPSYFDANLSLEDVDLGELVRRAKLTLPFRVEGKLSLQVNVGFPIDRPRDFRAYRFQGDARLSRLAVAGFEMAKVRAHVSYANGVLVLGTLHADTPSAGSPPGSFDGTARYQLVPPGNLDATLRLERLPLSAARRLMPGTAEFGGNLSGNLQFKSAGGRLSDPSSWEATAQLRSDSLSSGGLVLKGFTATVSVAQGAVTVKDMKAELFDSPVSGAARLRMAEDYPFDVDLAAPGLDLAFLQKLDPTYRPPVAVKGRLDFATRLKGSLRPLQMTASGTARAADLTVDGARLTALALRYAVTPGSVKVSDLKAELYAGEITGSATLPLRPADSGDISLKFNGIKAKAFVHDVPTVPVRLDGTVAGTLSVKLPPTEAGKPRESTTVVELAAPDLRVQGIPTQRLRCTVVYRGGGGSYRAECELAGGSFKLEGKLAPPGDPPKPPAAPAGQPPGGARSGSLQLRNIHFGSLVEGLFGQDFRPLHGTLSVDLPFDLDGPEPFPAGRGTISLADVRWGDSFITDRLQGDLRLGADGLNVSNVVATVGKGDLRLNAGYTLARGGHGFLNLELNHVDASRLLAVFPVMSGLAEGSADISLHLSGSREVRGSGRAVLTSGRVLGVEVVDWRVPIEFTFIPGVGGQFDVLDSGAQIARGRAVGRASLRWGDTLRLDGTVRFFDADLRTLLGRDSEAAGYAGGLLTGTLEFSSDHFRSADDLNATLAATLRQARTSDVSVLDQMVPFMGLFGADSSTRFQSGEIRGQLTRGVFRVQRFTLTGSLLQLMLQGSVTLAGRLDLEATAGSGKSASDRRSFEILGIRISPIGPLPLAVLVDASAFLANRVIRLRISGTRTNPVVRVEPSALLSEETVRFFFNRSSSSGTP